MATQGTVKLLSQASGVESRGQQFPRSSPLPRVNGLTVPQVALKKLFYYPIVLNHRNTFNSTLMVVVDVGTNDISRCHLSRGQSTVLCWPVNSFYTPVFRRDVLWYGDVCPSGSPSIRLSVRPGLRPPVFHTFHQHALTYWAEILMMTLFYCTTDHVQVSSICVKFFGSYAPCGT